MGEKDRIRSVAIIGAGASGAVAAAAFQAENYYEKVRVFERRESPGGTWIFDPTVQPRLDVKPGSLPISADPPLEIPDELPRVTTPNKQDRFAYTPIYESLTTNVPAIAMSFSDIPFAYGPFVPHHVPYQYIGNYFSRHRIDSVLELNTTLEDLSRTVSDPEIVHDGWKLTLRKYDPVRQVDTWWEEHYDAVILANGHYTVPYVPHVPGLDKYIEKFPGRIVHSKSYRKPDIWKDKKVVVIGNSASGHDVTKDLIGSVRLPVYQSRRSKSRWDGESPPEEVEWKPVIEEYLEDGKILFSDGSILDDVDAVIYCTGYKPSFPFWNSATNGRPLFDYKENRLIKSYWHTFFQDYPTLAVVGFPRVLTFRSMEYQSIALARLFAGRQSLSLPPLMEQQQWEAERAERCKHQRLKFHDIPWESGETKEYLGHLYAIAGLGTLFGEGRVPPVLSKDTIWAIENIRKYPEPGKGKKASKDDSESSAGLERSNPTTDDWVLVNSQRKDILSFL